MFEEADLDTFCIPGQEVERATFGELEIMDSYTEYYLACNALTNGENVYATSQ